MRWRSRCFRPGSVFAPRPVARADRDDGELVHAAVFVARCAAHVRVRAGLTYGPVSAPVPAHTSHSRGPRRPVPSHA